MRFLLGLGLGFVTPLIFRAWLKCPGPKAFLKIQGGDEENSGNGSVHEVFPPTSPDRTDSMSSEGRRREFDWPKVQESSKDSEFYW